MTQELAFSVPFSGFSSTDFINCCAATVMVLEECTSENDHDRKQRIGERYDGYENDATAAEKMQKLAYGPLAVQFIDRFGVLWGFMVEETK